jgi:D-amino peptidase
MSKAWLRPAYILLATALGPLGAAAQRPLKVYISVDMEGIAGVVTSDQLGPTGFEYSRAREFMTGEALAAIQGAKEAGATQIVVSDSHGNGQNLLIDQFPNDVTIIRSWPRPLMMMEGIDSTFDAALFIGYHASTANPVGVRAHTMSSATLTGVALNGTQVPEGGLNAAGPMEVAAVKRAISFHAAATMTPKAAQELIRARVKSAIERRASSKPYVLRGPVTVDLSFKHYRAAELLAYLPIVQRTSSHGVRFVGRDIVEVSRFLEFVTNYQPDITP